MNMSQVTDFEEFLDILSTIENRFEILKQKVRYTEKGFIIMNKIIWKIFGDKLQIYYLVVKKFHCSNLLMINYITFVDLAVKVRNEPFLYKCTECEFVIVIL